MSNLLTNKQRLLAFMKDGKWHHMQDLADWGGMRYGGRLHELKAEGYEFEKRHLGENEWEYRLIVEARQLAMEVR